MADFILKLQNLNGKNIGDILRSLNQLIRLHDLEIKANLPYILANFCPNNDFEKLARSRLIDYYRCYDEVLDILKSDDSFYISRALQCSWFFINFNSDCHQLVDTFFPYISFSTRMKVLKKYSKLLKNTDAADSLFLLLKERYGLSTAYILLPACSEGFIKDILLKTNIQAPFCVILSIFNLYPSVVVDYITYLLQCHSSKKRFIRTFNLYKYQRIFVLIASKEPRKFAILMERYHDSIPYLQLGKRASKHFVQTSFDSLKNNVMVYKGILTWQKIIPCLNVEQVSNLQFSILPSTVTAFINNFDSYCEYVSIIIDMKDSIKQNILLNNFNKKYGKKITEYLDALPFSMVNELPQDIAETWVTQKLPGIEDQKLRGDYLSLLPPDKAIPTLKKMVETESDMNNRAHFLGCITSVIKKNNSTDLIGPICEYAFKRFRNDRALIRSNFLSHIASYKNLINISDESWAPIEELCNFILLSDEAFSCECDIIKIMSVQIHSNLKKGLSVSEKIDNLLKLTNNDSRYDFSLCCNTPYEKQCLIWFIEHLAKTSDDKCSKATISELNLFDRICSWNVSHAHDKIEIPKWMMDKVLFLFHEDDEGGYNESVVLNIIKKDKALMYQFYDQIFPKFINPQILIYKLRYEPALIKENHIDILRNILDTIMSYYLFLKKVKLYSSFGIPEVFCSYLLTVLNNKNNESLLYPEHSVFALSVLLPSKQFANIITDYYPTDTVINALSDEDRRILAIQKQIIASFTTVNCPSDILESIKGFGKRDYTKYLVGPINSVCLRIPENKILPFLELWLDCPISQRKHFIRCYFKIAPLAITLRLLVRLFEEEKNVSIRLLLFEHLLRFFIAEPTLETFSILKTIIEKLQQPDEAALDKLFHVENVPDEFVSEYLQLVWDAVSVKNEELVVKNRNMIINLIDPVILQLLSEHFCDVLISHVFDHKDLFPDNLKIFGVQYLLYSQGLEQMNSRLMKFIKRVKLLITMWNDFNLNAEYVFASRCTLSLVIESLVCKSFNLGKSALPPQDLLLKFKSNLLLIIKEDDILEELIMLEVAIFLHSVPDSNSSDIMTDMSNFIESLVEKVISAYGSGVLDLVCTAILTTFEWGKGRKILRLDFSEALLKNASTNVQLLGLKSLPTFLTEVIQIERYTRILHTIFQNPDTRFKAFANNMFKQLRSYVNSLECPR